MATTDILYEGLTGVENEFVFPFPYLASEHVVCVLSDTVMDPTLYEVDGNTVRFLAEPYPIGDLTISRYTNVTERVTDYQPASPIRSLDLNNQADQFLYALQEFANRGVNSTYTPPSGAPVGGGSGPVITNPTDEGPLVDYIAGEIDAYSLLVNAALANLDAQLATFQTRVTATETTVSSFQSLLDGYTATLTGRIDTLEIETDSVAAIVSQLKTTTDGLSATIQTLQLTTVEGQASLVTELNSRVGTLEGTLTTVSNVQGDLAQQILDLQSSDGTNQSRITTLEQTTASEATRLTNQITRIDNAESQIGTLQTTTGDLATDLTTQTTRVNDVENSISTLNVTNGQISSRLTSVESDAGNLTTRVTTLEQTSTAGDSVRITQLETEMDSVENRVTSVEATSADHASRIGLVESNGADYSSRIGTLETAQAGQASSITSLNSRVGNVEGDVTVAMSTAAAANGTASSLYSLAIDANGAIAGFKLGSNGSTTHASFAADRFRIYRPNHYNQAVFTVNTTTGLVSMRDVEVDTLAADSIETNNLKDNSVSASAFVTTYNQVLPSNGGYFNLSELWFDKAVSGPLRVDFSINIQHLSNVEAAVKIEILADGVVRDTSYFKPDNWFTSTHSGFFLTLQGAGVSVWTLRASASNTQGGVSGINLTKSKFIISEVKK